MNEKEGPSNQLSSGPVSTNKYLDQKEIDLLEEIDGMNRLRVHLSDACDVSSACEAKGYSTGHDIDLALKSLAKRGYIKRRYGIRLTDKGKLVTVGKCNPKLRNADGSIHREAVPR